MLALLRIADYMVVVGFMVYLSVVRVTALLVGLGLPVACVFSETLVLRRLRRDRVLTARLAIAIFGNLFHEALDTQLGLLCRRLPAIRFVREIEAIAVIQANDLALGAAQLVPAPNRAQIHF